MSNPEYRSEPAGSRPAGQNSAGSMREAANDALSQASGLAKDAAAKAKAAAVESASTVTDHVKDLLDRQIGSGADIASAVASSARLAADDLSKQSPVLGGVVHSFANKIERYADEWQDQTIEQLMRTASDFTRRQPALVFGLAALTGYLMFRTMKSAPAMTAPSLQPEQEPGMPSAYARRAGP